MQVPDTLKSLLRIFGTNIDILLDRGAVTDITRVLYFFYVDRHIILTNGFIKKTKKTPLKEIERAKQYRSDYLRRRESQK